MVSVSTGDRQEYNGDESSLPYGHAFRLLNNKKPETMVFGRNSRNEAIKYSICGYNHMTEEETQKSDLPKMSFLMKLLVFILKSSGMVYA